MTDTWWPRAIRPSPSWAMSRPVEFTSGGNCRIRSRMRRPSGAGRPVERALALADNVVSQSEHVHARALEALDGFLGPADDGLVLVERRVEHDGHAGEGLELFDELPVER